MIQMAEKDFEIIKEELNRAYDGLVEYAETLEDSFTCSEHLDKIGMILDKYKVKNKEE